MRKKKFSFEGFFGSLLKPKKAKRSGPRLKQTPQEKKQKRKAYYEKNKAQISQQRKEKRTREGRTYQKMTNWDDKEVKKAYNRERYHTKVKAPIKEPVYIQPLKIRTDVFEEVEIVPPAIKAPKKEKKPKLTTEERKAKQRAYYQKNRMRILYNHMLWRRKRGVGEVKGERQPFKVTVKKNGPSYTALYTREYARRHPRIQQKTNEYLRKQTALLTDRYIVYLLVRGKNPLFSTKEEAWSNPDAIETKRNQVLVSRITRTIKQLQNG